MVGLILAGLSLEVAQNSYATTKIAYKAVRVKNGGCIRGMVRFVGRAPQGSTLKVAKDEAWCGTAKPSYRIEIGPDNGVKNAVVFLEEIERGKPFPKETKAVLDQRGCDYVPHVMAIPLGRSLEIVNDDPVLHNVHAYGGVGAPKTVFNIAQPVKGQRTAVKGTAFPAPGVYRATCDAGHPWMSAYIWVTDHPYYVVTMDDGTFELKDIPPGTYTVKMWHEGVRMVKPEILRGEVTKYNYEDSYEIEQQVTVGSGGTVTVNFELSLKRD